MSLSKTDIKMWLKEWRHSISPWGEKLDSNGYAKSILNKDYECYVCGLKGTGDNLARHEVYQGKNRKTSKGTGCWIWACPRCHDLYHADADMTKELRRECQEQFEKIHTREEFRLLFGRSYL